MYVPAPHLPEAGQAGRDLFTSAGHLKDYYGFELTDHSALPYPFSILMAEREIKRKLRRRGRYRELLTLEQEDGKLCFAVKESFSEHFCLYYIPVMPIYELWQDDRHKPCAELLTAVCAYLYAEAGIPYYRDEGTYMYYTYEALEEWVSDESGVAEGEDHSREKAGWEAAKTQGDLMQEKMTADGFRHSLSALVAGFKAVTEYEKQCLAIARSCLALWQAFPEGGLFKHANLQDYVVEDYDDNYVGMYEYISFIGSANDCLSDSLRNMVNDDFNERARHQEPETVTFFNEPQPDHKDELAYEDGIFDLIDDLCTLLYRKP